MPAGPKLELRGVRKTFRDRAAVAGLSFTLLEGEFVSLLGPSGCGKSTTLSIVAGFVDADAGDILIDGRSVNAMPVRDRGVGIVFQDYAVFTRLTVGDNLGFGLEARGVPRRIRARKIAEMAERLELTALLEHRAGGLNMSEMQRLAIGRALIVEPGLLLLDEPMSNLDAGLRATLRSELRAIQQSLNQTVLYVTHDQVEAMAMSDRILVMDNGELLQAGSPDAIYDEPGSRFVAEFVGDPPINSLPCTVNASGRREARTDSGVTVALEARTPMVGRYQLCVRPEHIRIERTAFDGAAAAEVRFADNLGAEQVLHVATGDDLLRVVTSPGFARVGDRVHVLPDAAHCHFFDVGSGLRVESRVDRPAHLETA
ncbi:MAG: ABC transporter ATP-binding protein [Burkholderiales bacterium]|nr:ABC transporter ATP-binding protein [Burkholderiales bacterium]